MNTVDTRNLIFSYLRKEPKLKCHQCDKILIWDNKPNQKIFYKSLEKNYVAKYCYNCYYSNLSLVVKIFNNLFIVMLLLLFLYLGSKLY